MKSVFTVFFFYFLVSCAFVAAQNKADSLIAVPQYHIVQTGETLPAIQWLVSTGFWF